MLRLVCAVCLLSGSLVPLASAGTLTGLVRDGATLAPLAGIDIDVFDDRFEFVATSNDFTAVDGTYTIFNLDPGDYYVLADPTLAQGYADRYHPGVSLPSQATLVTVSAGTTAGIDFDLFPGGSIHGQVLDATTLLPLAGLDLDVIASDLNLLSGVDAVTAADGSYALGSLAPGSYVVRVDADPTVPQYYVDQYYQGAKELALATAVQILGTETVADISFGMVPGGVIQGRLTDSLTGFPIPDVDIDLFDPTAQEILYADASSEDDGTFVFGPVEPGTYFLLADVDPGGIYVDTFFGPAQDMAGASPIVVSAGATVFNVDIALEQLGFIEGTIRQAGGAPLSGIDLDLLDAARNSLPQFDDTSALDGTYSIGPLPPGTYYLRADATTAQGYVDEYYPDTILKSAAGAIVVTPGPQTGIDITLAPGVDVSGTIRDALSNAPLAGIDLDILHFSGEALSSIDADTDLLGRYSLGALSPGTYFLRADPISQYAIEYYDGAADLPTATPIVVGAVDITGVDFQLDLLGPTAAPIGQPRTVSAVPNPAGSRVRFLLEGSWSRAASLDILDVRGRRVRTLPVPPASPALLWDARDERGRPVANGTFFVRWVDGDRSQVQRFTVLR